MKKIIKKFLVCKYLLFRKDIVFWGGGRGGSSRREAKGDKWGGEINARFGRQCWPAIAFKPNALATP